MVIMATLATLIGVHGNEIVTVVKQWGWHAYETIVMMMAGRACIYA